MKYKMSSHSNSMNIDAVVEYVLSKFQAVVCFLYSELSILSTFSANAFSFRCFNGNMLSSSTSWLFIHMITLYLDSSLYSVWLRLVLGGSINAWKLSRTCAPRKVFMWRDDECPRFDMMMCAQIRRKVSTIDTLYTFR